MHHSPAIKERLPTVLQLTSYFPDSLSDSQCLEKLAFFSQFEITASKVQQYQPKFNSSVSHSLTWSVDLLALYLVYASAERRKKKSNQSSSLMLLIYCDSTSQADIGNTYSVKSMEERKEENFSRKNLHSTVLSTCLSFFLYFQGLLNWVGISLKCILFLNTK